MIEVLSPQEQKSRINVESMVAFDGVSQYAVIPYRSSIFFGQTQWSVSIFVNPDFTTSTPVFFTNRHQGGPGASMFQFYTRSAKTLDWNIYGESNNYSGVDIPIGSGIFHFTVTKNGDNWKIYINGVLRSEFTYVATYVDRGHEISLNGQITTGDFRGKHFLSHLTFFNRTLTAQEINYIHAQGGLLPASTHAACVAHYPCTQREGNTLFDVVEQYNYSKVTTNLIRSAINNGWNKGAVAVQTIAAGQNGSYEAAFRGTNAMGISSANTADTMAEIEFAALRSSTDLRYYKLGISQGSIATVADNDRIKVAKIGNDFVIYVNGVEVFREVGVLSSITYYCSASIYSGSGNGIFDCAYNDVNTLEWTSIHVDLTYQIIGTLRADGKTLRPANPYHATLQNFSAAQHTGGSQSAYKEFYGKVDHRPYLQKFNGANQFAGDGSVQANIQSAVDYQKNWSISFWINNTAPNRFKRIISLWAGTNPQAGFSVQFTINNELQIWMRQDASVRVFWVSPLPYNKLVFVTISCDANLALKIYYNGYEQPTIKDGNLSTTIYNANRAFYIGNQAGQINLYNFEGSTNEICFFNKALTDQEAKELFERSGNPQDSLHENVVAHYVADQSNMQMTDIVERYNYTKGDFIQSLTNQNWHNHFSAEQAFPGNTDFTISYIIAAVDNIQVGLFNAYPAPSSSGLNNVVASLQCQPAGTMIHWGGSLGGVSIPGTWVVGDYFRLEKIGSDFIYYQNNVEIARRTISTSTTYYVRALFFTTAGRIEQFRLNDLPVTKGVAYQVTFQTAPLSPYHAALQNFTATEDRLIERTSLLPPLRKALRFDGVNDYAVCPAINPTSEKGYCISIVSQLINQNTPITVYWGFRYLDGYISVAKENQFNDEDIIRIYITDANQNFGNYDLNLSLEEKQKLHMLTMNLIPVQGSSDFVVEIWHNARLLDSRISSRVITFDVANPQFHISATASTTVHFQNQNVSTFGVAKGIATAKQIAEMWNNGLLMQPRKEWRNLDWQLLLNFNHIIDNSGTYELENLGSAGGNAVLNGYTADDVNLVHREISELKGGDALRNGLCFRLNRADDEYLDYGLYSGATQTVFHFMFWFYPLAAEEQILFSNGAAYGSSRFVKINNDGTLSFQNSLLTAETVKFGEWNFVGLRFTVSDSTNELFLNGDTINVSHAMTARSHHRIGDANNGIPGFNGYIFNPKRIASGGGNTAVNWSLVNRFYKGELNYGIDPITNIPNTFSTGVNALNNNWHYYTAKASPARDQIVFRKSGNLISKE